MTAGGTNVPRTAQAPAGSGADTPAYADIDDFAEFGIRALVTTRAAGSLSVASDEPVGAVMTRWRALRTELGAYGPAGRFATAQQAHGARVLTHQAGWAGWLRADDADGHFSQQRGTGLGVSVADCVPAMLGHPSGAIALVHAGWRGTAAMILRAAIDLFETQGLPSRDLRVHLGPAICGGCYEVGPDVYGQLTGRAVTGPATVDLRAILADQARAAGVRVITVSQWCTRCDNAVFYSHRAGDNGRQVAALIATP